MENKIVSARFLPSRNIFFPETHRRIILTVAPVDPELPKLMRQEMERVKRNRNIFTKLFGGIKIVTTFVSTKRK